MSYEYSGKLSAGKVISQEPADGGRVKKHSVVVITVSKGKLAVVPNLKGISLKKAEKLLKKASLKLAVKSRNYSSKMTKGSVISQNPGANSALAEGKSVSVVISKGEKPINVPRLEGMSIKKAKAKAEGFTIKVKYKYSEKEKDTVISQSLESGRKALPNTKLVLTVSKGAEPVGQESENSSYNEPDYPIESAESTTQSETKPQKLGDLIFE